MARQKDRGLRRGQGYTERRVGKDGSVFYVARWPEGDKYPSKVFRDPDPQAALDAAEQFVRERDRALRAGRHIPSAEMTVMDLVNQYLEHGRSRWAPATHANYSLLARLYIEPTVGKVRLVRLDTLRFQRWIDDLVDVGYTAETIRAITAVLVSAMNEGVALRMIADNPAKGITRPSVEVTEHVTWTADQAQLVLRYLANEPMWYALYRLALVTGMRPGELMALRWGDIDLDRATITVQRTMTRDHQRRSVVGKTTKGRRARRVALPPSLVPALKKWKVKQNELRLRAETWESHDAVFTGARGNHLPRPTWRQFHVRLCVAIAAALPDDQHFPRPTLHELRHTAATLMLEDNIHVLVVSEMLGHKRIETTLNIYQHVSADLQRSASDQLDRRLSTTTSLEKEAENG